MSDVVIIGGGLTGLLAARELMLAGADVAVVERGELAKESSWAGGGILSPLYPWRYPDAVTALACWSQTQYKLLTDELYECTGIDPEFVRSGLLILGSDDDEEAATWATARGKSLCPLKEGEAQKLEAMLASSPRGVMLPEVGQVRNPRLLRSLLAYLEQKGVVFHSQRPVQDIRVEDGVVRGVDTNKGYLDADTVVLASGAWSGGIAEKLGISLKIEPVKGQMLLFKAVPGLLKHIILCDGYYVIPRQDGHILVGSTMERAGFDKEPTPEAYQELYGMALKIVPKLADYPVANHWAGLRPGSENGVPYICAHPEVAGLYLSAGHFRNGVVMGPASARLLGDIILNRSPVVDPSPYRLV
ncbi:glycine oxidase ThiO [Pseudomonadota bacterium]